MLRAGVKKPIVFSMSADPVDAKIVDSYAHPGGNVTGITLFATDLAGKRMALLAEVVPGVQRFALVANPQHPGEQKELKGAQAAAAKLGFTLHYFPVRTEAELDAALAQIARTRIEAVLVLSDGFASAMPNALPPSRCRTASQSSRAGRSSRNAGDLMTYGRCSPMSIAAWRPTSTGSARVRGRAICR